MLIEQVIPEARTGIEADHEGFMGDLPSFGLRLTARAAWPILMLWLPRLARLVYKVFLAKFFAMPLGDILELLVADANALKLDIHPSVYAHMIKLKEKP